MVHKGGEITVGKDPESGDQQIIKDVEMLTSNDIRQLGASHVHGILARYPDISRVTALRGYFKL
ncbi:MAG: hypothetical protein WDO15_22970 [Bacteroidota bacterium]